MRAFCQILSSLVNIWQSYCIHKRVNFIVHTVYVASAKDGHHVFDTTA